VAVIGFILTVIARSQEDFKKTRMAAIAFLTGKLIAEIGLAVAVAGAVIKLLAKC
jgi:hypothetical protein